MSNLKQLRLRFPSLRVGNHYFQCRTRVSPPAIGDESGRDLPGVWHLLYAHKININIYIYRITILKSNIRRKESESSVKCAKLGMWELSLRGEVQAATSPPSHQYVRKGIESPPPLPPPHTTTPQESLVSSAASV